MMQTEDLNGSGEIEPCDDHGIEADAPSHLRPSCAEGDAAHACEAELRIVTRRRWGGVQRLRCSLPLSPGVELLVGRSHRCNHVILADEHVSRQHLRFRVDGQGRASIQDLRSRSGTRLNGRPIASDDLVMLHDGDEIAFGRSSIRFRLRMPRTAARRAKPPEDKADASSKFDFADSSIRQGSVGLVWASVAVAILAAAIVGACVATLGLWMLTR